MRKILVITDKSLKGYILDIFARHSDFKGKISGIIVWSENNAPAGGFIGKVKKLLSITMNSAVSFIKASKLNNPSVNTVLIAGENRESIMKKLYRVIIPPAKSKEARHIFFIEPFAAKNHSDFIDRDNFSPAHVRELPDSQQAFKLASELLRPNINPAHAASKTFRTGDGIEAFSINDVFVKISESLLFGCTYLSNGKLLNGCINGNRDFMYNECSRLSSVSEADIVLDDEVCPLLRLHSGKSYYHFLYEVIDKVLVAEELGFKGKYMLFRSDFAVELMDLAGISPERVIWIVSEESGRVFRLKNAFDVEGFTLSSGKGLPRLNEFADLAVSKLRGTKTYPGKIYLGNDNEGAYGFSVISPEKYSVNEMIGLFAHADIVMSKGRCELANALFMREGSKFVETFPFNWGELMLPEIISLRKLSYCPVNKI